MLKFIRNLASIASVVDRIAEIGEGVREIEDELTEVKCEIARQGEELDMLYQQHCASISLSHD